MGLTLYGFGGPSHLNSVAQERLAEVVRRFKEGLVNRTEIRLGKNHLTAQPQMRCEGHRRGFYHTDYGIISWRLRSVNAAAAG